MYHVKRLIPMTAKQLRRRRIAQGLSQQKLGDILQVTRQSVERWERGVYPVPHWVPIVLGLTVRPSTSPRR